MFDILDDTIAAVSSAAGLGARGIVRISGPQALGIAAAIFADDQPAPLDQRKGFRRYRGALRADGHSCVPAELFLFRAPRSYTRQDLVELHTIGSPPLLAMVLEQVFERGARAADAGEFTARAFFNGAMSLDEAESTAALIRARSDAQLRCAHRLAEQAPARQAAAWMHALGELLALVEAEIDFAEEPIDFITPKALHDRLTMLRAELDRLIAGAERAERFDVLPTVLLIGPPNAGKSSLMNVLSGTDRAICSAAAGTTRDILTAPMSLPGMDCLLADGAGLGRSDDELIQRAQAMTRQTASRVDLLCLVVDVSGTGADEALEVLRHHPSQAAVIAANKVDLVDQADLERALAAIRRTGLAPVVPTSAITGSGLGELRSAIQRRVGDQEGLGDERAILLSVRHRRALAAASAALDRALAQTRGIGETIDRADVIAFELREALEVLGTIGGTVTTEDLLAQVFANFCIGK